MRVIDAVQAINDANMLITSLAPLVHEALVAREEEVPDQAVAAAIKRMDLKVQDLRESLARGRRGDLLDSFGES